MQIASALGEFGASLALVARSKADLDAAVEQLNMAGRTAVGSFAEDVLRREFAEIDAIGGNGFRSMRAAG